jgi:hypothetical protein
MNTFVGATSFLLDGAQMSVTSENTAPPDVGAMVHIVNNNSTSTGMTVASFWQGSTSTPYVNNDTVLFETYNRTLSNSTNRSWAASCSNAYHDIPAGVTDSGTRVGVIGWAVSTYGRPGYVHAGTLESQTGVWGSAGFQSPGTPATAVINEACAVRGIVYADAVGATIKFARAGAFASDGVVGGSVIEENAAIVARAKNGTVSNYSFYGEAGEIYNQNLIFGASQIAAGSKYSQSSSKFAARYPGNSFEFGYPDVGYGSNIGATFASGNPFLAFCAEADPTGDTFRTRGKQGSVILANLGGSMIFGRIANPNASGQNLTEDARFTANGQLVLDKRPVLPSNPPASSNAAGQPGEVTYDANYMYVCVAPNTWKRAALSTW